MTSQLGKQTIAIRILLLISRSKSNETMKFGQLIECDEKHFSWKTIDKMWWRNYFHTQKSILIISLDQQSKFYTVCFYCMPNWGLSKYIETKLRVICFYLDKAFLETKRGLELVSLLHFLHDFWRKIYLLLNCINWANIIVWLLLLRGILTNMCIVIVW